MVNWLQTFKKFKTIGIKELHFFLKIVRDVFFDYNSYLLFLEYKKEIDGVRLMSKYTNILTNHQLDKTPPISWYLTEENKKFCFH